MCETVRLDHVASVHRVTFAVVGVGVRAQHGEAAVHQQTNEGELMQVRG